MLVRRLGAGACRDVDRLRAEPAADRCPRCGQGFHCGANDAGPCPCSTLALDASLLLAPLVRFLPPDDERIVSVARVDEDEVEVDANPWGPDALWQPEAAGAEGFLSVKDAKGELYSIRQGDLLIVISGSGETETGSTPRRGAAPRRAP